MKFDAYDPQNGPFYDETFAATGVPRPGFEPLVNGINALESGSLLMRQAAAERALLSMGITFTLYGDGGSSERIFPFDVIPRVVAARKSDRTCTSGTPAACSATACLASSKDMPVRYRVL